MKIIIIFFLVAFFSHCPTYGQWEKTSLNIELFNRPAMCIKGDTLILVNTQPRIYRSFNNGDTWEVLDSTFPQTREIRHIVSHKNYLVIPAWDSNPDSSSHGIYRSTDNGLTWKLPEGNGKFTYGVNKFYSTPDYLYGLHDDGRVCRSSDGGSDWTCSGKGLPGGILTGMVAVENYLYASTFFDGVVRSSDKGDRWEIPELNNLRDGIYSFGAYGNTLIAMAGAAFTSTDKGANWTEHKESNDFNPRTMATHGKNIFAGGWAVQGAVYYSTDTCKTWVDYTGNLGTERVLFIQANDNYLFIGLTSGVWRRPISDLRVGKEKSVESLTISPSPAQDHISIELPDGVNAKSLSIIDILGRTVYSSDVVSTETIQISHLPSGYYKVICASDKGTFSGSFTK